MGAKAFGAVAMLLVAGSAAWGCGAEAASESDDEPGVEDDDIVDAPTTREAVARAAEWVDAKLQYCWAPNGKADPNPACARVCRRTTNAAWDPYRSDCSGLVSWAWGLRPPGRVTTQFAPFKTDITRAIDAEALRPGDAVNNK